jgi:CxxC-x17-CxxC domain-containing protein
MSYADQNLTCRDCGQPFVWSAGEQEFYASRGLLHPPSRCPDCRRARKMGAAGAPASGVDRAPRQMFTAVCDNCGKVATVPFQPTSGKPVYCSECFEQVRAARGVSPSRRPDASYEARY